MTLYTGNHINWKYALEINGVTVPITVYEIEFKDRLLPNGELKPQYYFLKWVLLPETENRDEAEYGLMYDEEHDRFVAFFECYPDYL